MDPITEHHYLNIANGKSKRMDNGKLATVRTIIVEIDGVDTLIPTVWDGEIVDDETAKEFALKSGVEWPTRTGPNAGSELEAFDKELHKSFTDQTTPEAAQKLLDFAFRNKDVNITLPEDAALMDPIYMGMPEGTIMNDGPGTGLRLTGETFPDGAPMWKAIPQPDPVPSEQAVEVSIRPQSRPTEEYQRQEFNAYKDELVAKADEEFNKLPEKEIKLAENEFAPGGLATARKGITTKEGRDMANKKYQRDDKDADTNEDGIVSTREGEIEDALQKNELVEMSHGGMMGGLMGYDEVSGNPIPIGASPENVRDDIDAKLSTDEYVMPAHVVKWHGLKQIQMMQAEAEMGLMSMKMDGLIQSEDTPEAEEEKIEEPDEELDIEVAMIEVDDKLDDSDEIKKILPRTSEMPLMNKNKYAFAV